MGAQLAVFNKRNQRIPPLADTSEVGERQQGSQTGIWMQKHLGEDLE